MLIHIAVFKWKEGADPKQVDDALDQIRAIAREIPDIEAIYCGENFSRWNEGYTHAVVVLGANEAALAAYRNHPIHVEAAAIIESLEDRGIGIDFFDPLPQA